MKGSVLHILLISVFLVATAYSNDQLNADVNAIAAVVPNEHADQVVYFLVYGTSGLDPKTATPSIIAKNELNKIGRDLSIQEPLARCMQRLVLLENAALDAREYAFATLGRLASANKAIESMYLDLAKELVTRPKEAAALKARAEKALKAQGPSDG